MQQAPFICRSCLSNLRQQGDPLQLRLALRPRPLVRPVSSLASSPPAQQSSSQPRPATESEGNERTCSDYYVPLKGWLHQWKEDRRVLQLNVRRSDYYSSLVDLYRWKRRFTQIWAKRALDRKQRDKHRDEALQSEGRPELHIIQDLLCQRDVDHMRQAWQLIPKKSRVKLWRPVMVDALHWFPDQAPDIFRAIFQKDKSNFYAIVDSFLYMADYLQRLKGPVQSEYGRAVAGALLHCYHKTRKRYICLRQNTIYHILRHATVDQVYELLVAIKEYRQPLHVNTKQHFVWYLAKEPKYKPAAADLLREIIQDGQLDVNGLHCAALATAILTFPKISPGDKEDGENLPTLRSQLNQELLEFGLQPNIIHYTTIIRNLCDNNELETAWQVYDLMTSQGVQPDLHFYSQLLHGATLANDHRSFRRILELLPSEASQDRVIINGVLTFIHTTTVWELRKRKMKPPVPIPSFEYMFRTYSKIFDLGPLQALLNIDLQSYTAETHQRELDGMAPSWSGWQSMRSLRNTLALIPELEAEARIKPGNDTLNIMVTSFIRNFSQPSSLIEFYSNFRNRLKQGDPTILAFVATKGTIIHDTIIKAILEWQGTNMALAALDIVSDMLKDAAASRALFDADPQKPDLEPRHPAPSIYTWSVLLHGFMHRREHREQGDRIFKMMRDHGVEANRVTWNTLIAGHARLQAVGKTASALQRMEAAEYKPDRFTLRAFSYLLNREGALQMMQRLEDKKQKRKAAFVAKLTEAAAQNENSEDMSKMPDWIAAQDEYRIMEEQLRDISESVVVEESLGERGEEREVVKAAEEEWEETTGEIEGLEAYRTRNVASASSSL
ncbi:uncharacterized protein B0T23DRAFT_369828 [Neurospora hispaniola]|uniref:Pentatricopeptide repeat protein n=1 Tax=Neurospora hispaniola TaxID=588809 RepID=A0AAJ0MVK8_9PEZI|nr:hypothetical protein B0T23DRAFT_369828 [Neurospora hispaniola]